MAEQKRVIKNRPKTQQEIVDNLIEPYDQSIGKPPLNLPKRGNDVSMRDEDLKNISVNIEDIDGTMLYYFNNVIKPMVINEGTKTYIPIIYADSERWKSAQQDGYYRDKEGKMLFPVITLKRDNMEKNRTLGNKLDGNKSQLYQVYEKRNTKKNMYDNFQVLTNRTPVKEFYNVVVPDYYTITYSCAIYVSFMEDLNRIIESIGYRSDSYWGEANRFMFKAKIDNFGIQTTIAEGEDRRIVSNFTIIINGYLTPNNLDRHLATDAFKYRSKTQVLFTMEASSQNVEQVTFKRAPNESVAKTSYIPEGVNVNITNVMIESATTEYLNTNITKKANYMTEDTAAFYNSSIKPAPAGSSLPPTSLNDFKFFANGVYIDNTNIVSFISSGSAMVLTINPSTLGYSLDNLDEVIAVGKFN
jgi:hypothetical protein